MLGNVYIVHDQIQSPFCDHDVMPRVGLHKYEIFGMIEQERNRVGVKGLFEMTSWYLDVSCMWLRIDIIQ